MLVIMCNFLGVALRKWDLGKVDEMDGVVYLHCHFLHFDKWYSTPFLRSYKGLRQGDIFPLYLFVISYGSF